MIFLVKNNAEPAPHAYYLLSKSVPELCSVILWRFSSASTELSNKRKALLLYICLRRAAAAGVWTVGVYFGVYSDFNVLIFKAV